MNPQKLSSNAFSRTAYPFTSVLEQTSRVTHLSERLESAADFSFFQTSVATNVLHIR